MASESREGWNGPGGRGQRAVWAEGVCPGVDEDPGQARGVDYHVKSKNGDRLMPERSAMPLERSGCPGGKGTGEMVSLTDTKIQPQSRRGIAALNWGLFFVDRQTAPKGRPLLCMELRDSIGDHEIRGTEAELFSRKSLGCRLSVCQFGASPLGIALTRRY